MCWRTEADLRGAILHFRPQAIYQLVIAGWAVTPSDLVNSHSERCVGCT